MELFARHLDVAGTGPGRDDRRIMGAGQKSNQVNERREACSGRPNRNQFSAERRSDRAAAADHCLSFRKSEVKIDKTLASILQAMPSFFCMSSRVMPLVSGYQSRTTKNCTAIITEKKTNG